MERRRRQWRERGEAGVPSKGSPGRPRLSEKQIARLERELERGPLVHGWVDQRWTSARVKTLIGRLFHVSYTVEGTWRLLKRRGWSWQQPARRAIERDDDAVELWRKQVWPRAKTWGRRGCTPVVHVRGRGSGRVSMAGMTCYKPGERSRLFCSIHEYTGRKDQPKGFGWRDFRGLLIRARIQLGGPIVLLWDNVRLHLTKSLRAFIEAKAN